MDWIECNKRRIVKEVSIDLDLIESLKKTSLNKLNSQSKLNLDEVTAVSKLSLAYDSLREILEALSLKNQFKIYNHDCFVPFIQEILRQSDKAQEFDEVRKIRNDLNYYGKDISLAEAKEVINKIISLREHFLQLLNN